MTRQQVLQQLAEAWGRCPPRPGESVAMLRVDDTCRSWFAYGEPARLIDVARRALEREGEETCIALEARLWRPEDDLATACGHEQADGVLLYRWDAVRDR